MGAAGYVETLLNDDGIRQEMGNKRKTTYTSLSWIQHITFPEFQIDVLKNVNRNINSECISLGQNKCRVLDIGCGSGDASIQYINGIDADIFGVDWRDSRSSQYAKRFTAFEKGDIEKDGLPFEDDYFDIVITNQVFEHLKNIYTPLSEIHRILRGGASLL